MRVEISVVCFASGSWLQNTRGESCISQQVGQFDHRHKLLSIVIALSRNPSESAMKSVIGNGTTGVGKRLVLI
jgi:hypothetical protein